MALVETMIRQHHSLMIGEWAKSLIASGELDAAIAEIAASDTDLRSWSSSTTAYSPRSGSLRVLRSTHG